MLRCIEIQIQNFYETVINGWSIRKKSVVFFEVEGGNDKEPDGHRKDTMPIVLLF